MDQKNTLPIITQEMFSLTHAFMCKLTNTGQYGGRLRAGMAMSLVNEYMTPKQRFKMTTYAIDGMEEMETGNHQQAERRMLLKQADMFCRVALRANFASSMSHYVDKAMTDEATAAAFRQAGAKKLAKIIELARARPQKKRRDISVRGHVQHEPAVLV